MSLSANKQDHVEIMTYAGKENNESVKIARYVFAE